MFNMDVDFNKLSISEIGVWPKYLQIAIIILSLDKSVLA